MLAHYKISISVEKVLGIFNKFVVSFGLACRYIGLQTWDWGPLGVSEAVAFLTSKYFFSYYPIFLLKFQNSFIFLYLLILRLFVQ